MKNDKQNELLRLLARSDRGVPAATLASMLGISERTVRNYVREINARGGAQILSTRDGYRLQEGGTLPTAEAASENNARVWKVLSRLLTCKEGMDVYEMGEELYVSASTIANSLPPQTNPMVRPYHLQIAPPPHPHFPTGRAPHTPPLLAHPATQATSGPPRPPPPPAPPPPLRFAGSAQGARPAGASGRRAPPAAPADDGRAAGHLSQATRHAAANDRPRHLASRGVHGLEGLF